MTEADPLETLHAALEADPNVEIELAVPARVRRRGGRHPLRFERLVRCPRCAAPSYRTSPGCDRCTRGLELRTEALTVHVPAGSAIGTKLRIKGKGHETLAGGAGNLLVTIAPRPSPLRQRLRRTWAALPTVRPSPRVVALALGALGLIGGGLWLAHGARAKLAPLGAPCGEGSDCRSGDCLALYERPTFDFAGKRVPLPARRTGSVCTTGCDTDADCPANMRCAPVERTAAVHGMDLPPGEPNALACAPADS